MRSQIFVLFREEMDLWLFRFQPLDTDREGALGTRIQTLVTLNLVMAPDIQHQATAIPHHLLDTHQTPILTSRHSHAAIFMEDTIT